MLESATCPANDSLLGCAAETTTHFRRSFPRTCVRWACPWLFGRCRLRGPRLLHAWAPPPGATGILPVLKRGLARRLSLAVARGAQLKYQVFCDHSPAGGLQSRSDLTAKDAKSAKGIQRIEPQRHDEKWREKQVVGSSVEANDYRDHSYIRRARCAVVVKCLGALGVLGG